ncbi:uncharacterized protein LOC129748422 isoform X1 [Uranotaenia lowii]|uniref:uncharacterized protein LOC129748422 isoform X1 n=1 Tax=Uranotaenia lowii TaxID=190385 RepID=UPI002479127F|nr:uncharacterized protein LOC129748422 isoform X1 [Uranotaenia lowii]XP_055599027.1 uncharacterized protein LOC129748422 isoform X1 [Uranotaenia lowii]
MKQLLVICSLLGAMALAIPVPEPNPDPAPAQEPKTDIELMKIPLEGDKELDVITLVNSDDQKINERNKRTIGILRELFPTISQITSNNDNLNTLESLDLAGLSDTLNAIRVARAVEDTKSLTDDQNGAESQSSAGKSSALDELTLDSEGADEDRNKRFLSFGGSSGGAGGSGNFLFDIIRQTADRAARAAGTVYRVVAGTDTLTPIPVTTKGTSGSGSSSSSSSAKTSTTKTTAENSARSTTSARSLGPSSFSFTNTASSSHSALVSGSSGTEQSDEKANAPDDDHELGKGDGYTEGIPGPVTRLFVLANRGLSNLIQDLILRIAQTSERVVNFKARLITSLI